MSFLSDPERVAHVIELSNQLHELMARVECLESENKFLRSLLEQKESQKPWRRNKAGVAR